MVAGSAPRHDGSCQRIGEASHPGPAELLRMGTSNPGGLRGKEAHVLGLGPGVWFMSETQLSVETQRSSKATLTSAGRQVERQIRVLHGAPAPLRAGSVWAGAWTGVTTISDFPCQRSFHTWTV